VRIRKRRIVERPRLFALLDQSKAPVRMLIAPAGYGKTTLAEQWVARDGRSSAWFTARSSATDVAALALGIAKSAIAVVGECDERLRAHLKALPAPAENVETLAEILGEELFDWPDNAWLVLDDYHEVAVEPRAEDFVKTLLAVAPLRVLVASRVRPAWVSDKDVMYDVALELDQEALAMDDREAADVLIERSPPSAQNLAHLARGWPAVIGLASASSAELAADVEQVPESLYRFFADEVFAALGDGVRQGLTTLSVAPVLDYELAAALLGDDAHSVIAAALDVGLLVERKQQLDLHPLARAFLEERGVQLGFVPSAASAATCIAGYRVRREWDAAYELVVRFRMIDQIEPLTHEALDELLDTARLPTVDRWCQLANETSNKAPIFALARAETALRYGRHLEAVSHAELASEAAELQFRSLSIAGRAAHLASREEDALDFYRRAEAVAQCEGEVRDARWGQLMCSIDLELPTSAAALAELSEGVRFADARELVRAAAHAVYLQTRQGGRLDLDDADTANEVLPAVNDPIVESSFLSGYGIALALASRYDDAFEAAEALRQTAERYRFDFAIPYSLCAAAMAQGGMRRWDEAERAASLALEGARARRDLHADLLSCSVLFRLYAQQSKWSAGIGLRVARTRGAVKGSIAEVVCSRALVFACAGRTPQAMEMIDEVRGTTNAVEPIVLEKAVEAVCAVREGARDVIERANALEQAAFETGAVDMLVTSYRSCPELLSILLRSTSSRRFRELVERVGDSDLAGAVGQPIAFEDKRALLSPRELEVYELLRARLTNREIGRLLFIEESTVKAHSHRIYDKLGVRSRSALAVQAALERSDQATSATGTADSGDE
jgi:ATP/maltotriose-dependent transcriptional regulator MalT